MLKIKKIKPLYNSIVTTMNFYDSPVYIEGTNLIDSSKKNGSVKEYQKVLEVGDMVRNIKVGDLVCINPKNYANVRHNKGSLKDGIVTDNPIISYNFNIVNINGEDCLFLRDNDIDFVIEEFEETKD